jgi:signal transduction histidine kinase
VRHAPGASIDVAVATDRRGLTVDVTDSGGTQPPEPVVGGGQGLVGMAERAALLGGSCQAGPDPEGPGWRVTALLPLPAWHAVSAVARPTEQPV